MTTEKLSGKRAIITGGSRGIGFSTAKALAAHGVNLLISGKNPESIAKAAKAVADEYRNITVMPFAADLSSKETPQAIIYEAVNKLGGIDFLINNAGISLSKPLENTEEDEWDAVMTVNAKAPYFLCKYALPHLRKSIHPVIIQIASVVAFKGYEHQSAYAASKHAILGFTKTLTKEVQNDGIRVYTISPGGVATDMATAIRPDLDTTDLIHPDEIAETLVYLLQQTGNAMIDNISLHRFTKPGWL